jgi:hypothetical protein
MLSITKSGNGGEMKYISMGLKKMSLIFTCFFIAGCSVAGVAIHNSDVKKFPLYTETEKVWGPIPDNYGRVVIMFPKESDAGKVLVGSGSDNLIFSIDGDKKKIGIGDQNFVFIDLPKGNHLIHKRFMLSGNNKQDFEVRTGEIIFITIDHLKVLNRQEAEPFLVNIHHHFRLPLPYDKQEKSAEKQKW